MNPVNENCAMSALQTKINTEFILEYRPSPQPGAETLLAMAYRFLLLLFVMHQDCEVIMYLKGLLIHGGGCILEFPVTMKSKR